MDRNASFDRKLVAAFLLAILMTVLLISISIYTTYTQYKIGYAASRGGYQVNVIKDIAGMLAKAESDLRGYAISGDRRFDNDYQTRINYLHEFLMDLNPSEFIVADQDRIQAFRNNVVDYINHMEELKVSLHTHEMENVRHLVISEQGRSLYEGARDASIDIYNQERRALLDVESTIIQLSIRLRILLLIGSIVSIAILVVAFFMIRKEAAMNAQLLNRLEETTDEVTRLNRLSNSLQACTSPEDAYEIIGHFMRQTFSEHDGTLYVMRASRDGLESRVSWGEIASEKSLLESEDCWALRLGKPHGITDADIGQRCHHVPDTDDYLCVPMMAHGEIIGLLHTRIRQDSAGNRTMQLRSWSFLEDVATHIGPALASIMLRDRLRTQSFRDPLTGAYNRRYLEEVMDRETLRAERMNGSFGIVMLDMDHFKQFNDTHGHQAGDAALQTLAKYLKDGVRGVDIVCRYGGEEFTLVLPGASLDETASRAEQLNAGIEKLQVRLEGQLFAPLTASFGIAAYPLHGDTWQTVLRAADTALYRAKQEGRNRVVISDNQSKPCNGNTNSTG